MKSFLAWSLSCCLCVLYASEARADDVLRIMAMGDSLTSDAVVAEIQNGFVNAGFEAYEFVGPVKTDATPKPICRQAYGGMQLKDILNGRTVKDEYQAGAMQTVAEFHPNVILLMGGTNDIGVEDVNATKQAFTNLLNFLTKTAPDAQIFIAPIPPVHSQGQYAHLTSRIADLNAYIASEVEKYSKADPKIHLVDASKFPLEDEDFGPDGLHFLESGKIKVGKRWLDAMASAGLIPSSVVK